MKKLTATSAGIVLPSALDVMSVSTYIAATVSFFIGILSLGHPNLFGASANIAIQATVPLISLAFATGILMVNMWRTGSAKKAAIAAGYPVFRLTRAQYDSIHSGQDNSSVQAFQAPLANEAKRALIANIR